MKTDKIDQEQEIRIGKKSRGNAMNKSAKWIHSRSRKEAIVTDNWISDKLRLFFLRKRKVHSKPEVRSSNMTRTKKQSLNLAT